MARTITLDDASRTAGLLIRCLFEIRPRSAPWRCYVIEAWD